MALKVPICRLCWVSPAPTPSRDPGERWSFLVGQPLKTSFPTAVPGVELDFGMETVLLVAVITHAQLREYPGNSSRHGRA